MTAATTRGAGTEAGSGGAARRWRPSGRTIFFTVVLLVLLVYTEMAFQLDWITGGGRIGPGFFPRIIGGLGVLVSLIAVLHSVFRAPAADEGGFEEDELGEGDLGRHPVPMVVAIAGAAVLLVTLTSLGAIVASAVFLLAMLAYLNRGHWVANIILSVAVPVGMYLLFQTMLNAGLPSGVLPRF